MVIVENKHDYYVLADSSNTHREDALPYYSPAVIISNGRIWNRTRDLCHVRAAL